MNTEPKFSVSSQRTNFTKLIIIVKFVAVNRFPLKAHINFKKCDVVDNAADVQRQHLGVLSGLGNSLLVYRCAKSSQNINTL